MDSGVPKWHEESFDRYCRAIREKRLQDRIKELEEENKKLKEANNRVH